MPYVSIPAMELWPEETKDKYNNEVAAYHSRPRYPVHEELKRKWKAGEKKVLNVDFRFSLIGASWCTKCKDYAEQSCLTNHVESIGKDRLTAIPLPANDVEDKELFAKLKWEIGMIQFNYLHMSSDGKAIEANPATHRIAEYVHQIIAGYKARTEPTQQLSSVPKWVNGKDEVLRKELFDFLCWYNGYPERKDLTQQSVDDWLNIKERERASSQPTEPVICNRCKKEKPLNAISLCSECWQDVSKNKSTEPVATERHMVEGLLNAAGEILHLHLCEQEGLSSGQPSPKQWIEAVNKLSESIIPFKNEHKQSNNQRS